MFYPKKRKLKSNGMRENATFIMRMTNSIKYDSALENVKKSSKTDLFRENSGEYRKI